MHKQQFVSEAVLVSAGPNQAWTNDKGEVVQPKAGGKFTLEINGVEYSYKTDSAAMVATLPPVGSEVVVAFKAQPKAVKEFDRAVMRLDFQPASVTLKKAA